MESYTIKRKGNQLIIVAEGWNYRKIFLRIATSSVEKIVKIEKKGIIYISIYYHYELGDGDSKLYMESIEFKDSNIADKFIEEIENVR